MNKYKFKSNIKCTGCLAKVTPLLDAEPTIEKWEVDIYNPLKVLSVETAETDVDKITKIIENTVGKAGFTVEEI